MGSAPPTVVLVHGAWADGSSWTKVISLLLSRGLSVSAGDRRGLPSSPSVSPCLHSTCGVKCG